MQRTEKNMEFKKTLLTAVSDLKKNPITILLVDDQPLVAEAVRQLLMSESNITLHYCQNSECAIQKAIELTPTVILQDLVMPGIDGLTLLHLYQNDSKTQNVPVIVLSTEEDPLIKAEAFSLGAVDYLIKLPDKVEFLARLRHHATAYIHLLERNAAHKKLIESQEILKADLQEAAMYVKSLLPIPLKGDVEASWRFLPSAQLGGDAFGYHWLDAENFALYLLDVCGHGVGAALLSISVANIIRSQTLLDTDFKDPSHVLSALNEVFPMEKHNEMFFTIWYGVYNKKTRILKYSSGGHPPAFLFTYEKLPVGDPILLSTEGLVIGAVAHTSYANKHYKIPFNNRLFLFSDGVYDIKYSNNEMMAFDDLKKIFGDYVNRFHNDLDQIIYVSQQKQQGDKSFKDDFSIVEFTFH